MNIYILSVGIFCLSLFTTPCTGQASWEQLASIPGVGVERVFNFEIDGIVYVGGGRTSGGSNISTLRAYNVETNSWSTKASFPGQARRNAFGFAVGGKGYIGCGYDGANALNDFWSYNPVSNSWTQLSNFPDFPRNHALTIADSTKAYVIGGGRSSDNVYYDEMWEFDAATESWTALNDIPGVGRWRTFGWIIGQKLYVGGGDRFPNPGLSDFYSYDIPSGNWSENQLPPIPTSKTSAGFYFALQGKGYFLEGSTGGGGATNFGRNLYVYDPVLNTWDSDLQFTGPERELGFSSVVGDQAIIGLGRNFNNNTYYRDIYSFTPEEISSTNNIAEELGLKLYPNPVSSSKLNIEGDFNESDDISIAIYDVKGSLSQLSNNYVNVGSGLIQLDVDHLIPGTYYLQMNFANGQKAAMQFIKQ